MAQNGRNLKYRQQDTFDWEPFRRNLRSLIDSRGMTCKDFALYVDLAPTTVTRYLTERTPDIVALWRICDKCDVSLDWLIGRQTSRTTILPDAVQKVAAAYSIASEADKEVIQVLLKKYEKE